MSVFRRPVLAFFTVVGCGSMSSVQRQSQCVVVPDLLVGNFLALVQVVAPKVLAFVSCLCFAVSFVEPMLRVCVVVAGLVAHVGAAPVVNVRLSQPPAPLPEVSAAIVALEATRGAAEAEGLRRLDAAFEEAVESAEVRIKAVLARVAPAAAPSAQVPVAFLSSATPAHSGFVLRVSPSRPVSNAVLKKIAALERVRGAEEQLLVDQGVRELGLLVDVVVAHLQSSLRTRAAGFIGTGLVASQAVGVRFFPPSEPFVSVSGLVSEMEGRRGVAEGQLRQHISELEAKLLQRMNGMVVAALGK